MSLYKLIYLILILKVVIFTLYLFFVRAKKSIKKLYFPMLQKRYTQKYRILSINDIITRHIRKLIYYLYNEDHQRQRRNIELD